MSNKVGTAGEPPAEAGRSSDHQALANAFSFYNRDPKHIHDPEFFKVGWHDVFAEPDPGVHSFRLIWSAAHLTFSCTRLWTYRILSICGVLSACCFGLEYGCTACYTIWCCMPSLTLLRNQLWPCREMLKIYLAACVQPIIYVVSFLFWNIRVTSVKGNDNAETV